MQTLEAIVPIECANKRLDQVLAILFTEYSRSRLKEWIEQGLVLVNGQRLRPKDKLAGLERIEILDTPIPSVEWVPEVIPLNIVFQDEHLLIVDKPMGFVVHPATGNPSGTLVNALLHLFPELSQLPRAGIVHRLDKDTTGLLVVARTLEAHQALTEDLQARAVSREYEAIVGGRMPSGGTVEAPIGRHPKDRKRMAVNEQGKPAITHYRVIKRFTAHTHLQIKLETGRTHQIRVHMAHIQYPIVGDKTYGGRLRVPPACDEQLLDCLKNFKRQALHARRLSFKHPIREEVLSFESPLPTDMQGLIEVLERHSS